MKMIKEKMAAFTFMLIGTMQAWAVEIKKPNYVKEIDTDKITEAGGEIEMWIGVILAVVISIAALIPGYYFFNGENEKAIEKLKSIGMGAVAVVVVGGVVFGIIEILGS